MVKHGEIISPLMTALLSARVARHLKTGQLFPGAEPPPLNFNERELQVIEQSLRLATRALQNGGVV